MNSVAFVGAAVLGLGFAAVAVWESPEPSASARLASVASAASAVLPVSEALAPTAPASDLDAGAEPTLLGFDGGEFGAMPALGLPPTTTSRSVRFGVILVAHASAQGAAPGTRSKADAQTLATRLAEEAKTDFKAAVSSGDSGSMNDAGRIGRGVLEPEAEMILFSLEPGAVSAPIDTPRGFWIVKRID